MAFWTSTGRAALAPKKKDLFLVRMTGLFGEGAIWWAKAVSKPAVQYDSNSGPQAGTFFMGGGLSGQKLGYINPGALQAFAPINLTLVDPDGPDSQISQQVMGYLESSGKNRDYYGIKNATKDMGFVFIQQLSHRTQATENANLFVSENWSLYQPHILSVNFGDLSYTDENLVEISMTIGYTGFQVDFIDELGAIRSTHSFGEYPTQQTQGETISDVQLQASEQAIEATTSALETLADATFSEPDFSAAPNPFGITPFI